MGISIVDKNGKSVKVAGFGLQGPMGPKGETGPQGPAGLSSSSQLLDNAYWASKDAIINQRGQEEYTAAGYTIDRLIIRSNSKVAVEDGGLVFETPSTSGASGFNQSIEFPNTLLGKTITVSVLIDENTYDSNYPRFGLNLANNSSNHSTGTPLMIYLNGRTGLLSDTGVISSMASYTHLNCGMYVTPGVSGKVKMRAMKLELGTEQTLAHQDADGNWVLNDPPPNRALELAKCQRHQVKNLQGIQTVETPGRDTAGYFFMTPVTMRAAPTLSTISISNNIGTGEPILVPTLGWTLKDNGVYTNIRIAGLTDAQKDIYKLAKIPDGMVLNANL